MQLTFHIWRQNKNSPGKFQSYAVAELDPNMSFLEALDYLNERILSQGEKGVDHEEPIAFDYDCREGICGMCSLTINGIPHGPGEGITTCQVHLRSFQDGEHVYVEPWRARAFPVVRDLVVDRSGMDRIMAAGGYISVNSGSAPDAHTHPVQAKTAEQAFNDAACIGCGACVAACKNSSAMLFVGAKVAHLQALPQGQVEAPARVVNMVKAHDQEGFGSCSHTKACEAACPKNISARTIVHLNQEYLKAAIKQPQLLSQGSGSSK